MSLFLQITIVYSNSLYYTVSDKAGRGIENGTNTIK